MRMLDLCCCQGVGAWGYWRSARFSEIVGVDVVDYGRVYPFDFVQADALRLDYDFLLDFDFIHASPPCQAYSKLTRDKDKHLRLIAATHLMLAAAGKPYVIENVEGSSRELKPNLCLSGWDVGLNMTRRRYFHLSWISDVRASQIRSCPATHQRASINSADYVSREAMIDTMFRGVDDVSTKYLSQVTRYGLEQGIPPVMTRQIADMLPGGKFMIG